MIEPLSAAALVLQGAIAVAVLEAARRRDVSAAVNASVSLAVALLPTTVEFLAPVVLGPELPLWIAAAGLLHSLGMLGLYESVWWWDHLAHAVSASLVAALVYAGFVVRGARSLGPGPLPVDIAVATLLFVLAVGVFWELLELVARDVGKRYGVDPILVHYGRRDTALDLVFDLVGALVVVLLDLRAFVPVARTYPRSTEALLFGAGVTVIVGSVLMALVVGLVGRD